MYAMHASVCSRDDWRFLSVVVTYTFCLDPNVLYPRKHPSDAYRKGHLVVFGDAGSSYPAHTVRRWDVLSRRDTPPLDQGILNDVHSPRQLR